MANRIGVVGLGMVGLLLFMATPAAAQTLADFDYENLAPRGIMVDYGWVRPSQVKATTSVGGRVDLGFLGPGVRVTAGLSHWSSTLQQSEVDLFARQVADLVEAQTGNRPEIDLGEIRWSDVALSGDAHFVWRVPGGVLTYAGAGATAHLLRGSGAAIDGTFIEDLLNTIRAGANLHGGVEVPLGRRFRVVGESRLELVQSASYAQLRVGIQYLWGAPASGEIR
jgi:hypothetical protein